MAASPGTCHDIIKRAELSTKVQGIVGPVRFIASLHSPKAAPRMAKFSAWTT